MLREKALRSRPRSSSGSANPATARGQSERAGRFGRFHYATWISSAPVERAPAPSGSNRYFRDAKLFDDNAAAVIGL